MTKYFNPETVEAQPMTAKEAIEKGYKVGKHNGEDGYELSHKDGHKSWYPKDTFRQIYSPAETNIDKMEHEWTELMVKHGKFVKYSFEPDFRKDEKEEYPAFLKEYQADLMLKYMIILNYRTMYEEYKTEYGMGDEPVITLPFGAVICGLDKGYCFRRRGWSNEDLVVIKQVPSQIEKDIIPKMQSLPDMAKKIILDNKQSIEYNNQFLIYDRKSGKANSWIPSMDDMYAFDWLVVS